MKISLYIGADNSELMIVQDNGTWMLFERPTGTSTAVILFDGGLGGETTVRLTPILADDPYVQTSVEATPMNRQPLTFTEDENVVHVECDDYGPLMRARWE